MKISANAGAEVLLHYVHLNAFILNGIVPRLKCVPVYVPFLEITDKNREIH